MYALSKLSNNVCIGVFKRSSNFKVQWPSKSFGTQKSISKVGFIGLGAMGSRMVKNLMKQYKDVHVFDINASATAEVQKEGAKVANNIEELVSADCIITMLPSNQVVLDVCHGLISKVAPGTLLIDSSTVDPEVPQKLAKAAEQKNITFLDAPVSGGVVGAAAATLTFMLGGTKENVQRCEPVLRTMGKNLVHCGNTGSGQVAKICNNMLLGISMIGVSEAMNLGIRLGLEPKVLAGIINTSTGRCWSSDTYNPVPGIMSGVPSSDNYQGGFICRLITKDLDLATQVAERSSTPVPFGKHAFEVYKTLCDQGKSENDFSIVYQYLKNKKK